MQGRWTRAEGCQSGYNSANRSSIPRNAAKSPFEFRAWFVNDLFNFGGIVSFPNRLTKALAFVVPASLGATVALAQGFGGGLNTFGMPGAIDTPSATRPPDGTLAFTGFAKPDTARATLTFQMLPRVTVALRYASVEDLEYRQLFNSALRDRSFDLHWQITDEGRYMPAVAVGLRDFIGTGVYSGEYIVASRSVTPRLRGSVGLGWGRLATHGSFSNPLGALSDRFKTRPEDHTGLGGRIEAQRFFRGDAAAFANLEYQYNDRLTFLAEYSSDAYAGERLGERRNTPFNFGFRYALSDATTISGYAMQGSTVGLSASFALDPRAPSARGLRVTAPPPILSRPSRPEQAAWPTAWTGHTERYEEALSEAWGSVFREEGLRLQDVTLQENRAIIRMRNARHEVLPRALGRTARIATYGLPPSVEEIVVIPMVNGIAGTAVIFNRSALEAHEFNLDGAEALLATTRFADPLGFPGVQQFWQPRSPDRQAFTWSLGPYITPSYFDPNVPLRADLGLRLDLRYHFAENLSASTTVTQRLAGNISGGSIGPASPGYPRVRTNSLLYSSSSPVVDRATVDYTFRLAADIYGRLSLGLLERMYAGGSAELLWSRVDSPFALGIEANVLRQRDPDALVGTGDLRINSWHASAYYSFSEGFHAQLDVGRYLAGDTGATLRLEREFANGIRVGAYATLTNMPFDVFGEGSFDKGINLTIPLATLLGEPTTTRYSTTISSITRDGGARVNISNRLYPTVRESRQHALRRSWEAVLQ